MATHTDRIAAATVDAVFGTENTAGDPAGTRLLRTALRLLAHGEPITITELADAAGVPDPDLANAPAGRDIEYDEHGRIVGWGLTLNPTPHRFTIDGRQLYTYCAPDTLIFPVVIGQVAHIESDCPATGTTIRLTLDPTADPTAAVTGLDPASAVVTIVDPAHIDDQRVRATVCDPQRFFTSARAAHDWQARNPGMTALSVADAHTRIALPIARAILGHPTTPDGTDTRPAEPPGGDDLDLNKAHAAAVLGEAARRLHRTILLGYARAGRPPTIADLHAHTDVAVDPALAELVDADLVIRDEVGELAGAYPFSTAPTAHRLALVDGTTAYAMCAIDALGMSAMLDQPVTITSTEPGTAHTITVQVDRNRARWRPTTAVVHAAHTGDCRAPSAERTCRYINFFTTEPAARAWAARHPELDGTVLGQADALSRAVAEFGALVHAPGMTS